MTKNADLRSMLTPLDTRSFYARKEVKASPNLLLCSLPDGTRHQQHHITLERMDGLKCGVNLVWVVSEMSTE